MGALARLQLREEVDRHPPCTLGKTGDEAVALKALQAAQVAGHEITSRSPLPLGALELAEMRRRVVEAAVPLGDRDEDAVGRLNPSLRGAAYSNHVAVADELGRLGRQTDVEDLASV